MNIAKALSSALKGAGNKVEVLASKVEEKRLAAAASRITKAGGEVNGLPTTAICNSKRNRDLLFEIQNLRKERARLKAELDELKAKAKAKEEEVEEEVEEKVARALARALED